MNLKYCVYSYLNIILTSPFLFFSFQYSLPGYKTTASKILEKNLNYVEEALKKRIVFQRLWPSMFLGIVNDALEDYTDLNRHMKLSMLSLLKKCKSLEENDSND